MALGIWSCPNPTESHTFTHFCDLIHPLDLGLGSRCIKPHASVSNHPQMSQIFADSGDRFVNLR
jgi:hypothetical protein